MKLNALLDVDLVAVEADDEISLMLDLKAPADKNRGERPPASLQVVLDRSGSMYGGRLEAAQAALIELVDRLDARDNFGVVAFDDSTLVAVPAGPLTDKELVKARIAALMPGGSTDLSAGYLRGVQEARRVKADGRGTLLLLSDGHANRGVTDPDQLGQVAQRAQANGVATSTLGLGLDYDEVLMSAVARGGQGNAHFAEEPDTAAAAIAGEVDGLLTQVAQAASLTIRFKPGARGVRLRNDLPAVPIDGGAGVMVELGDFNAEEERKIVMTFDVPAMSSLGLAEVAELELQWVELPSLEQHTVTIPVHVNVVPGDQAAGRIPNPTVRTELAYQQAQEDKREAARALRDGDMHGASLSWRAAGSRLMEAMPAAPADMQDAIADEIRLVQDLDARTFAEDARRLSKLTEADVHRKVRRDRRRPS